MHDLHCDAYSRARPSDERRKFRRQHRIEQIEKWRTSLNINMLFNHMQVIMLDEHGLDVNSEKMASLFGDAMNTVWTNSTFRTIS